MHPPSLLFRPYRLDLVYVLEWQVLRELPWIPLLLA
jgi:hypothetical protein